MKMISLIFSIMLLFTVCFAQTQVPVAASAPAVAAVQTQTQAPADSGLLGFLEKLVEKIPGQLPAVIITILGILTELALRFVPTANPQSLFIYASKLLHLLGDIFDKLASLLDSILPQVTKQ